LQLRKLQFERLEARQRQGSKVRGGKWDHFDTFHFEYRPQIIALAKQGWPGK
jgi:hypothetical protein